MRITHPNFVVGIGASAGGLNAYKAFFDALPSDTGMAFVVISHIHPAAHSQLAEILSRHTKMTVVLAASEMKMRANQVYVIPGNADLLIEDGALIVVSPRTKRNAQVDIFFTSLAIAMGERSIGIVFSGYDGDGAEGCKRIEATGEGVNPTCCSSDAIASALSGYPKNNGLGTNTPRFDAIMLKTKTVDSNEHQRAPRFYRW